jgi:predicted ATPase/class 3 adenylate cyclase
VPEHVSLPSGTVTFLFTDVESSTRLWEDHPTEMEAALRQHDTILRSAIEQHGGYVFSTAGDSFAAAFGRAADALQAAEHAQGALGNEAWPPPTRLRVRMGVHTGEVTERDGDYFGPAVNRAARIMAAGNGGQILTSATTASLVSGLDFVDCGEHRLKDLDIPEHLYQLGSGQFPTLNTLDRTPHNLPRLRTELVGRDDVVREVVDQIGASRLVTITGSGGMGKTTVAVAAAGRSSDKFPDGVWFVDLVPVTGDDRVAGLVAQTAGLRLDQSPDPATRLGELIGDRRMLLVIDNCEHVIDEAADVIDSVLEHSTDAQVLATSRERLDLPGEHVTSLGPLDTSGTDAPAVRLLVERAASVGADLGTTDETLLSDVCAALDGMPLAIELAAANLTHLRVDELADRLTARFDLLETTGRGRRSHRQSSLRQVLTASWDLLDPAAQALLMRLAVFPSTFDAAAVADLAQDLDTPSRSLKRLVDSSLVDTGGPPATPLRLLESVREFAVEHWESDSAEHRDRHLEWVRDHLLEPSPEQVLVSGRQLAAYATRGDDFRAAITHARDTGRLDLAADLIVAGAYHARTGEGTAAIELLDRIDTLRELPDLSPRASAKLHLASALASLGSRDLDRMERDSHLAVETARAAGLPEVLVMAQIVASWRTGTSNPQKGIELLETARQTALSAGLDRLADAALTNSCSYLSLLNRDDEAAQVAREVLERAPQHDYPAMHACASLAVAVILNDPTEAQAALELSRTMWTKTGIPTRWFDALMDAIVAASLVDPAKTLDALDDAQALARRTGVDTGLPDLLLAPAVLAHRLGDHDRCRSLLQAVKADDRPTTGYPMTILYRRLRSEVGQHTAERPPTAAVALAGAVEWLRTLQP